jgi:hypothetical protein
MLNMVEARIFHLCWVARYLMEVIEQAVSSSNKMWQGKLAQQLVFVP